MRINTCFILSLIYLVRGPIFSFLQLYIWNLMLYRLVYILLNSESVFMITEWEYDSSSGYYYNQTDGCYYDPNSGFYYTESLGMGYYLRWCWMILFLLLFSFSVISHFMMHKTGKWVTQAEVLAAIQASSASRQKKPVLGKPSSSKEDGPVSENKPNVTPHGAPPLGPVLTKSLNPTRTVKGAPSTLTVNKRKRLDQKPKVVSQEEAAALKAREAARRRVEAREKSLLGLYKH